MQHNGSVGVKYKRPKLKKLEWIFIIVMLSVPIIHYSIFFLYVNFDSICLAFQLPTGEWSLATMKTQWNMLFVEGSILNVAIRNTVLFFAKDMLVIPFQVLIAYFFYKKIRCNTFFRIAFYLPALISGVVMATVYKELLAAEGPIGIIYQKLFNVTERDVPRFLGSSEYANGAVMIYTLWTGFSTNLLLFMGALARIPTEVLESARLDGISPLREFVAMIVPLIWPTIGTTFILGMTGLFNAGGPVMLFTGGMYNTWNINYYIYSQLKDVGVAAYNAVAATGMIFAAFGVPLLLLAQFLVRRVPTVEY